MTLLRQQNTKKSPEIQQYFVTPQSCSYLHKQLNENAALPPATFQRAVSGNSACLSKTLTTYTQWLTAANQPQPPEMVQIGWQEKYYTALPHRCQEYLPNRLKGHLYSSRGKKMQLRKMPGWFALSVPTLPATSTTDRETGPWCGEHGSSHQRISKGRCSAESSQAPSLLLSTSCYQLEEGEVCSWLRCTSAGIQKSPWEGNRKDIDVSQGIKQKPQLELTALD